MIGAERIMKEAMFYEKGQGDKVHCFLCPHNCVLAQGELGICAVRKNMEGKLYSLNYQQVSAMALDPIEKKPLAHFHPGRNILSVGSVGCNLKCAFCQNHEIACISMAESYTEVCTGEELVEKAVRLKCRGNIGIAYTYNEPSIWYEYVYETAKLAREKGLYNVLVTNGYIGPEALDTLLPYIDAMNIDLKAFREDFYKNIVKGRLKPVMETIARGAKSCHVEVTSLIIPELNDSPEEMEDMCGWLSAIDPGIPLHLSRYFPRYEMTEKKPTDYNTLVQLAHIAGKYLKHVHLGNVDPTEQIKM